MFVTWRTVIRWQRRGAATSTATMTPPRVCFHIDFQTRVECRLDFQTRIENYIDFETRVEAFYEFGCD